MESSQMLSIHSQMQPLIIVKRFTFATFNDIIRFQPNFYYSTPLCLSVQRELQFSQQLGSTNVDI